MDGLGLEAGRLCHALDSPASRRAQQDVRALRGEDAQDRFDDATLILVSYRHGLRATEICDLEWSQVEWGRNAALHVRRLKNGKPATHPLRGDEICALRELQRQFPESAFVFATERGGPFTADAANRLIKRIGERAGFPFPGTRPHATARLRLCAGECGPRYARYTGLAWSQVNSAHRQIHRAFADAVQGFLAEVI
jgi:integrase